MLNEKLGEECRIIIDEASFQLESIEDDEAEDAIDEFNDALSLLVRRGIPVSKFSLCLDFECRVGIPLYSILFERATRISPDTLRRLGDLLQRCHNWDETVHDVPTSCLVDGEPVESWSIGYITTQLGSRYMGCLSCGTSGRRGVLSVAVGNEVNDVFFFDCAEDLPAFWQLVLRKDNISESEFFDLSSRAYTRLALHPNLDFKRFAGEYSEVYNWVIQVLEVLNNHFEKSCTERKGVRTAITGDLASHGIEASPDSPKTHRNTKAMKQRDVIFEGIQYRCEWHAKRLWNVDRIHFTTAAALPDGRTLVGIFVDHLNT